MRLPNLTDEDVKLAESLYKEFFSTCGQDNPTDINTTQKKMFFDKYGIDALIVMQRCRKKGSDVYPFTKREKNEPRS